MVYGTKLTTPESKSVYSQYVNASSTSNVTKLPKMHKNGLIIVPLFEEIAKMFEKCNIQNLTRTPTWGVQTGGVPKVPFLLDASTYIMETEILVYARIANW